LNLTDEEKRMLDGEMGEGVRKAMDMLVAMGKAFDAPRMIPVTRTHVAMSGQEGDTYWCELLVNGGAACKIIPTTNPNWDVPTLNRRYEVPADRLFLARRTDDVYRRIGAAITYCCTPELAGNVPVFGEHVAFSESSATPYVNAVLGARSNRESSVSALASSVTGVTPYYGLHLDENRRGNMTVYVDTEVKGPYEWGLLGWFIGLHAGTNVPVILFNKKAYDVRPTPEELLYFTTESNTSGAMPMFHMPGITPEAPTAEAAFGGNKSASELRVTRADLEKMENLISDPAGKIHLVLIGCPHYTYAQLRGVADLINDRRIHPDVDFWILSSWDAIELARRSGHLETIERSGIRVVPDTCMDQPPFDQFKGKLNMTDSAKCAHYQKRRGLPFVLRRIEECIDAAVKSSV
jgi:predicted aconitase